MYKKAQLIKKYWDEEWDTAMSFEEFVFYMNDKKSNFVQHWDLYEYFEDFNELDELPKVEKIKKPAVKQKKNNEEMELI